MPAIDEHRFLTKSLLERIVRIEKIAGEVESAPTSRNKTLLKVMAEKVDDYHSQFLSTIQKIVAYNYKNGIDEDLTPEIVKFEDPYFTIKAVMEAAFPSYPRPSLADMSSATVASSASGSLNVQLPKIKLPEFSGDVRLWQAFAELFQATVNANSHLSDVQKHMYLRSALSGEALALVAYLPLTGPNYKVCWETLKRQYDNLHLQTTAHLETLYSLPSTMENPSTIRTFASQITEATGALGALGYEVEGWAVPLLFICCKKLHSKLREDWERHLLTAPDPSIRQFTWFLQEQARVLEASRPAGSVEPSYVRKWSAKSSSTRAATALLVDASRSHGQCPKCGRAHMLDQCGSFRQADPQQRLAFVKEKRLCLLCLLPGHFVPECSKQSTCKYCPSRHHSLLHLLRPEARCDSGPVRSSSSSSAPSDREQQASQSSFQVCALEKVGQVLLATAVAQVLDFSGAYQNVRLLIDPASQATFITRACVQRLGLCLAPANVPVLGVGQVSLGVCRQQARCNFRPEHSVELQVDALVVDSIACAPTEQVSPLPAALIKGLPLADPEYYKPAAVDVLLGAEWFGCIIQDRPISRSPDTPSLLKSIWGYCIVGRHQSTAPAVQGLCMTAPGGFSTTDTQLRRFWELEEPPEVVILSPEDQGCQDLYLSTVSRLSSGRFVVALPFRTDPKPLGDSRLDAFRRFLMFEKRLQRNSALSDHYREFIQDYVDQSHMRVALPLRTLDSEYYFLHHCIFRNYPSEVISRFRVVFESSMTRIMWQSSPEEQITKYYLTTVTRFCAIRTLHQLVADGGQPLPATSDALLHHIYMDDVINSVPAVEAALQLKDELVELLGRAGFELRKWMSNRDEVLRSLPPERCAVSVDSLAFDGDSEPSTKILGLVWVPKLDSFSYTIAKNPAAVTGRLIISDIAKLFDPVGFISQVVFVGKSLIRRLWQPGIGWDDPPPDDLCYSWVSFCKELRLLERFSLPCWVQLDNHVSLGLHGFADVLDLGCTVDKCLKVDPYPGPVGWLEWPMMRTSTGVYRRAVVNLCPLPKE